MPKFYYRAIDRKGEEKIGHVEAFSEEEANAKISSLRMIPTRVGLEKEKSRESKNRTTAPRMTPLPKKKTRHFGKIVNQEHLTIFIRQLATMLQSGLPLLRSLEVLIRQEKNRTFRQVITDLADNIRTGNTLSDGLQQYPKIFDRLFISMVKAGETGGVLDTVLKRLALIMEKNLKVKKRIKTAMFYPIIVISMAFLIVGVLMVFVIPRFQSIYNDLLRDASLPALTQFIIDLSNFIKEKWWMPLLIIVAVVFLYKTLRMSHFGARFFDWLYLHIPTIGELLTKAAIARFSRTFGTLLSSGVPILQALTVTRDVVGNRLIMDALDTVHDRVRDGESISAPLARSKIFPTMVTSMIGVGEESGELAEMLNRIADNYDEDVDNAVAGLTSIIEPVMIVILALIVGVIVMALFLPIIGIITKLSGG